MTAPNANANTNSNTNSNSNANTSGGAMSGGMSNATSNSSGGMSGGMGEMMSEMMKQMGKPPKKEIYPSLMELPQDLPPEKRDEIKKSAAERMNEGDALVASGLEKLADATKNQDFARMQEANAQIRRGQTLLESGIAVERALAENQNPQDVSFRWFKQNMNLAPATAVENPHGFFGLSWFHYITMLTLAAFSAAMIWM